MLRGLVQLAVQTLPITPAGAPCICGDEIYVFTQHLWNCWTSLLLVAKCPNAVIDRLSRDSYAS